MKKASSSQSQYLSALVEKRCEIYSVVAQYLLEIEEAIEKENFERFGEIFEEIRKSIRTSLAFLTEQIFGELEHIESLVLPHKKNLAKVDFDQVKTRLSILHVQFSRALKNPEIKDIEEILALPDEIREEVENSESRLKEQKERDEKAKQAKVKAEEAEKLAGENKLKSAAKAYQRAIQLNPNLAVYHNDLGVVYSMQGLNEKSKSSYIKAVELNEQYPEQRTNQWARTYFNLARVCKKIADELWRPNLVRLPLAHLKEANLEGAKEDYKLGIESLEEYINVSPQGEKIEVSRQLMAEMKEQIEEIDDAWERLKNLP